MNTDSTTVTLPRPHPNVNPYSRGGTLLLVEDSRVSADCVRLLFRAAGGRLRRAECLRSARRHISLYTPDAAIIDLGLPDGSGLDLIAEMARRRPRTGLIIATSGDPDLEEEAMDAGADRFLAKPFGNGAIFNQMLTPVFHGLRGAVVTATSPSEPALRDDLYLALDLLNGLPGRRGYALQFIRQVARVAGDDALLHAVHAAQDHGRIEQVAARVRERLRALPLV
jgi:CheY-like chemotaxis protein